MEMISRPLHLTELQNREELERANKIRLMRDGDFEGNRHERRLAAKRERQILRRERVLP